LRSVILLVFIILASFALPDFLCADQSLTITLDPSQKTPQSNLQLKHETLGAARKTQQASQIASRSKQAKDKHAVVARIGVVTASRADIRFAPDKKGRVLFSCPTGSYLGLVGQYGSWYGVLMIDYSTGWVEKSKVKLLDYQVTRPAAQSNGDGSRIVNSALQYLGIPYKWGGYSANGLDCSGFVKAVFASNGISLPRVARDQALVGRSVGWSELQPGDRLYFACKGGAIDHAGIYIGNGLFIHSSVSRRGVAVDNITKPFYMNSLMAARRS
jgi:cell wall-associated NlpC family hydrolase